MPLMRHIARLIAVAGLGLLTCVSAAADLSNTEKMFGVSTIWLEGWRNFPDRARLVHWDEPLFQGLTKPNLVAFLHVDPQVAGVRKGASITPTECGVHDAPHLVSLDRFISYQTQIQDALASEFENIESITIDGTYDDPVAISTRATHSLSEWLNTRARLDG